MRRLALPLLFAFACAAPASEPAPGTAGPTEAAFALAAREYAVPVELLKAQAWVEARFLFLPGQASIDGGFGPMHLSELDGSLPQAMALTGLSREALTTQLEANLRGGAAVLRAKADVVFAEYPALREEELSDWYDVVTRRTGYASLRTAELYANRLFYTVEHGADRTLPGGERVRLVPTAVQLRNKRAFGETHQFAGVDGYGPAVWDPANAGNYSNGRNDTIQYVIIHTVQGSYAGCISWFQNPTSNVSSHYVVSQAGDVTQMVAHADTAWHASNYNSRSVGIEHEGFVDDPAWATPALYEASAALTRWIADRESIPKDRAHILGHVELPGATHTDPGPHWNWGTYMGLVTNGAATPQTGVLRGVVYVDPDVGARIPGATVRLSNGAVATTDATGSFRFDVEAGPYTITAEAAGYGRAQLDRVVTANAETWGSVGLRPAAPTGVYRGTVFELLAGDPCRGDEELTCDMTTKLDGATVVFSNGAQSFTFESGRSNDQSTMQGGGRIWIELPAGTWTATASLAGYETNARVREVVAGQETWGSIGILPAGAVDHVAPVVTIESPLDGAALSDLAELPVRGSVQDGSMPASVLVNGAEVPLIAGRFDTTVALVDGENVITVVATDTAGNEGSASVTVTADVPASGVDGFVFQAPDEAARLQGAQVELTRAGETGASIETGADGTFHLDVAPGDWVVKVRAAGHRTHAETLTIGAGARLQARFGLQVGADVEPFLELTSPEEGAALAAEFVVVTGVVSEFDGLLTVNGEPATIGAESDGERGGYGFFATIPLTPGENVVEAKLVKGELLLTATRTLQRIELDQGGGDQTASSAEGDDGCSHAGGGTTSPLALLGFALLLLGARRRG